MEASVLYAGIACVAAAIVGGGVKLLGQELPLVNSLARQALLAAFGLLLIGAATSGSWLAYVKPAASHNNDDDSFVVYVMYTGPNADQARQGPIYAREFQCRVGTVLNSKGGKIEYRLRQDAQRAADKLTACLGDEQDLWWISAFSTKHPETNPATPTIVLDR
jgi:hypothetical protein